MLLTTKEPASVSAPLTALATFTVSVAPLFTVIVSAEVGRPPTPEPAVMEPQLVLDEITMLLSTTRGSSPSIIARL